MRRSTFCNVKLKDYDYTGEVLSLCLSKGLYDFLVWGAEGGKTSNSTKIAGSKGGYSNGQCFLQKPTNLYIFVGGQGSSGTSTSRVNGGWNGGGASVGKSSYDSEGTYGYSYPACGGGATDMCLVTSTMDYSKGRTNRSSASLLSRFIVAGGGGGGSYCGKKVESEGWEHDWEESGPVYFTSCDGGYEYILNYTVSTLPYKFEISARGSSCSFYWNGSSSSSKTFEPTETGNVTCRIFTTYVSTATSTYYSCTLYGWGTVTNTTTYRSDQSQQGGGTSGKGKYPGTQSSGGNGNGDDGGFGYGGNQSHTNYRYCSGGAGGGWYGGGVACGRTSTSYVKYTGGGSGFVNTKENAQYRPDGYTGLELMSGTTIAGDLEFECPTGGTETGHGGNGYARIIKKQTLTTKFTEIE